MTPFEQPPEYLPTPPPPEPVREDYLNVDFSLRSWLLTIDHKRIAILYLISITLMFFLGGAAITIVRLNLMTPNGELISADTYNKLFTMHGIIMVFFFLMPAVPAVLGNFLVPMMIGAQRSGLSAAQFVELVCLCRRRGAVLCSRC